MFELRDSKLGKVKIINITEARQNMASIMNDSDFNYVITKNNKPIRVIINYDEYKSNRDQLEKRKSTVKKEVQVSPTINSMGSSDQVDVNTSISIDKQESHQEVSFQEKEVPQIKVEEPKTTQNTLLQEETKPDFNKDNQESEFDLNSDNAEQSYYEKFKKLYERSENYESPYEDEKNINDVAPASFMPEPIQQMMRAEELALKHEKEKKENKSWEEKIENVYLSDFSEDEIKENSGQADHTHEELHSFSDESKPINKIETKEVQEPEPPSIQDLLNELEQEKLSEKRGGHSVSGNYFNPDENDF